MLDPAIGSLLVGCFALLFAGAASHKLRDLNQFAQVFGPRLQQANGVIGKVAERRLIEESQKTLGRLSVAQRAYEILKSQARTSNAGDWVAARKGGPDVTRVFEAADDPSAAADEDPETALPATSALPAPPKEVTDEPAKPSEGAEVVRLDRFRKK